MLSLYYFKYYVTFVLPSFLSPSTIFGSAHHRDEGACRRPPRKLFIHWMIFLVLLWGAAIAADVVAQESSKPLLPQSEKVDAVLVLDGSGSMRVTDPLKLRDEGAKLFVQFLKDGDRLAIVGFSDKAEVVRPLSAYAAAQAGQFAQDLDRVGNSGQFTDIFSGMQVAADLLKNNQREGATPVIILMSDGKMDPNPAIGTATQLAERLKTELLPDLKSKGIKVHTLYFSEEADQSFLKEVALATDGVNFFTPTADTIHQSFADLFLVVKKPQVLPLTSKGFRIDADVQEATFYINRDGGNEIALQTPSGKRVTAHDTDAGIRWFSGQKFEVITISSPEIGDWVVYGVEKSEGFATVLTNMKLIADWPASVYADSDALVQARLFEGEKPIVLPEMTSTVRFAIRITPTDKVAEPIVQELLVDDGSVGDRVAADGMFSRAIDIKEPGEYRLVVLAKAPTFERTQQIPFRVRPRLVNIRVIKASEAGIVFTGDPHGAPGEHAAAADEDQEVIEIELSEEARALKRTSLKLLAIDKDRSRIELPVQEIAASSGENRLIASVGDLGESGSYDLQATLLAEGKRKNAIREVSPVLAYSYERKGHKEIAKVVVVPKEKTPESPAAWPHFLIVTLGNLALAGGALTVIKKLLVQGTVKMPELPPLGDLAQVVAALEERSLKSELNLDDPIFVDEALQFLVRDAGTVVSAAPEAEPGPSAPTPPSPAAAPAAVESPAAPSAEPGTEASTEEAGSQ